MSFLREILYALEVRVCLKKVLGILKYRLKVYFNFQNKLYQIVKKLSTDSYAKKYCPPDPDKESKNPGQLKLPGNKTIYIMFLFTYLYYSYCGCLPM